MNRGELSDLEEGEILEYESLSPNRGGIDCTKIKCRPFDALKKENINRDFALNENKSNDLHLPEEKKGCVSRILKDKLKFNKASEGIKSNFGVIDLESISSEGECKSDEETRCFADESKDDAWSNKVRKPKGKHSTHFYGAVEDIMSEIGETICRKSRNYKKRKSKDPEYNLYKTKDNSYDLWRHKIFSSHLRSKKHKRKISFSDSDSESKKEKVEKRKKRIKRREVNYEQNERDTKKPHKDFDEMRRNLLEKLKKQKAEEESKASIYESTLKAENEEIEEVDMLIDCTNYVDKPTDVAVEVSEIEEWREKEETREDELDLVKLRLIALASNKNKKDSKPALKAEKSERVLESNNFSSRNREEIDLDRNELLLRAEALKTALLKKHQKRLNKMKVNKFTEIEKTKSNETSFLSSHPEKNINEILYAGESAGNIEADAFKENVEKKIESGTSGSSLDISTAHIIDIEVTVNELSDSAHASDTSPKKMLPKTRTKRKKRKSSSFASNLKENSEKSEALEEDDRTLRSQLLSDLLKKKSLKDSEKKSVLMDSIQTSANKNLLCVKYGQTPVVNTKPPPVVKNNLLKKVNVPKKLKPVVAPPIPKPEIQRIIVHLGSEDSSDEDAVSFQPPNELGIRENQFSRLGGEKEEKSEQNCYSESFEVNKKEDKVTEAAYGKSVELLLNQARKKIEGKGRIAGESTLATPEAVYKHLPLSQRLEYIRLKQKIAERERLKNQKKENSGNTFLAFGVDPQFPEILTVRDKESVKSISETSTVKLEIPTEINSKPRNAPSRKNPVNKINSCLLKTEVVTRLPSKASNTWGGFAALSGLKEKETSLRLVNNEAKNNFVNIYGKSFKDCMPQTDNPKKTSVPTERNTLLLPFSQTLLTKLKLLLKKIKIEKMIEENYEKEISKLKNQLSLFEKKKGEQRFKIKKLGEESIKTYKAIQGITANSKERAIPNKDEGKEKKGNEMDDKSKDSEKELKDKIIEEEKKEDEEGMKVPKETNTEIMNKTSSEINKELNIDDEISETVANGKPSSIDLLKYQSPLQIFNKASDFSEKVDPNVMMCQFDLMGVCKDEECAYQHLRLS